MLNQETIDAAVKNLFRGIKFTEEPSGLYDPLRYMISIGGKRIRPTLCLIAYSLYKDELTPEILEPAAGIEVFHSFTLIHDDIMDRSPLRRGVDTVWKKWDSDTAILSGDVMCIDSYAAAESFNSLFGLVPRSMIGSLLAFIAGSTVNAWIMSKMKVATKGKGFGWRAIISTIGGEATDSLIFFPIAFGGMLPFGAVINLMFTQVVAKTLYEIIILPVTSWVVRKVKAYEGIDTYDNNISYNPFKVNEI